MSVLIDKTTRVMVQGLTGREGTFHAKGCAAYGTQIVGGVTPGKGGTTHENWPVFNTVAEAVAKTGANASVIFVPPMAAADAIMEAADAGVELIVCITEGIPTLDMVRAWEFLQGHKSRLIGPNCPGIISPGKCKIGIMPGHIHKEGGVGIVSRSGTLTYEAVHQLTRRGIGQSTAIGIGGDAYPGTDFVSYLEMFEQDPQTKAVVIVGEMGGNLEEQAGAWLGAKKRRIKLVATISGFCQEQLPKGMKFGHAGAKEGLRGEGSARSKVDALRKAGAIVPDTFGALGPAIEKLYRELVETGVSAPAPETDAAALPRLPKSVDQAIKSGDVMVEPLVKTTISDDRGDEPCYDGYPASELIKKGYQIPHVIGLLWNKKLISAQEAEIVKRIIMLSADHGPCVSGALVTIIAAGAGINMAQAVAAGMVMIGPRFGGAVTDAGKWFKYAIDQELTPEAFLDYMKANVGPVPGIGHRVKSVKNPDKRVSELVSYVKSLSIPMPHLDFALHVEKITSAKKDTLILNVDGTIAAILVDLGYPVESLNGFFILARTIGFIGHWIDQKRQGSRLIRLFDYLVNYATPKRRDVPPLG